MKTIWKYELTGPETKIIVPWYARVIACHLQNGIPYVWIMLNKEEKRTKEIIVRTVGTGHDFDFPIGETQNRYISTMFTEGLVGNLVFHVFSDDNKDGV